MMMYERVWGCRRESEWQSEWKGAQGGRLRAQQYERMSGAKVDRKESPRVHCWSSTPALCSFWSGRRLVIVIKANHMQPRGLSLANKGSWT